jgi:hypothetical protein
VWFFALQTGQIRRTAGRNSATMLITKRLLSVTRTTARLDLEKFRAKSRTWPGTYFCISVCFLQADP